MKKHILTIFLFVVFALALPLNLLHVFTVHLNYSGALKGTGFAVLGVTVLFAVLPRRKLFWYDRTGKILLGFCGFGAVVSVIQIFIFRLSFDEFSAALAVFTLPLAGYAWSSELKKALPNALALLAVLLLAIAVRQICADFPPFSLTGNWNWSWTLLVCSFPFCFLHFQGRYWKFLLPCSVIAAILLPYLFFQPYTSRATVLCGILSAILLLGACPQKYRKYSFPLLLIFLLAGILLIAFRLAASQTEIRGPLYRAGAKLVARQPFTGIGSGRFEAQITGFLPAGEALFRFGAERHPHPHNEFLALGAAFGVFGIVYLAFLFFGVFRRLYLHFPVRKRDLLLYFAFLVLFLHGNLDVLLAMPHSGMLFYLLAGVLLAPDCRIPVRGCPVPWCVLFAASFLLLTGRSLYSSGLVRKAMLERKNPQTALRMLKESLRWNESPETLYTQTQIAFYNAKDPKLVLQTLDKLESRGFPHFGHSNSWRARALFTLGDAEGALRYFAAEKKIFPFSAVNAFFYAQCLNATGRSEAARLERQNYESLMKKKKLSPDRIGFLLHHPSGDDNQSLLEYELNRKK